MTDSQLCPTCQEPHLKTEGGVVWCAFCGSLQTKAVGQHPILWNLITPSQHKYLKHKMEKAKNKADLFTIEGYLTPSQACKRLGKPKGYLNFWLSAHANPDLGPPTYNIHGRRYYKEDTLLAWWEDPAGQIRRAQKANLDQFPTDALPLQEAIITTLKARPGEGYTLPELTEALIPPIRAKKVIYFGNPESKTKITANLKRACVHLSYRFRYWKAEETAVLERKISPDLRKALGDRAKRQRGLYYALPKDDPRIAQWAEEGQIA